MTIKDLTVRLKWRPDSPVPVCQEGEREERGVGSVKQMEEEENDQAMLNELHPLFLYIYIIYIYI